MSPAAFIDANIFIYAAGREHPQKEPCVRVLAMATERPLPFVTNSEVIQELLHLYMAQGRWALGRGAVHSFAQLMHGRIEPVYAEDVLLAARLADNHQGISTRDLVHAAVMQRMGIDRVISVDTDFDRLPNVTRLDPARLEEWADSVLAGDGGA